MAINGGLGDSGFVWFVGVVEDIIDPLKAGRLKVRILNEHFGIIAKEDLPWAQVMTPITSASNNGIGISPTGIMMGSHVVGFYMDGHTKRMPVIMGSLPLPKRGGTVNDVNYIARGDGPIDKSLLDGEPESAYGAEYPFNKTLTTSSGHILEIDDTKDKERIHLYHKSGTYIEIFPDGSIVTKSQKDDIRLSVQDSKVIVENGDYTIEVRDGEINTTSSEVMVTTNTCTITVGSGGIEITSEGDISVSSEGDISISSESNVTITAVEKIDLIAPRVGVTSATDYSEFH